MFDLYVEFKITTNLIRYSLILDVGKIIGGIYATYSLVLITLPSGWIMPGKFLKYITKELYKKELKHHIENNTPK